MATANQITHTDEISPEWVAYMFEYGDLTPSEVIRILPKAGQSRQIVELALRLFANQKILVRAAPEIREFFKQESDERRGRSMWNVLHRIDEWTREHGYITMLSHTCDLYRASTWDMFKYTIAIKALIKVDALSVLHMAVVGKTESEIYTPIRLDRKAKALRKSIGLKARGINELFLQGAQLYVLPVEIVAFKNLQLLDISLNHLTSLPKAINRLSELQLLHAGCNELRSLPTETGQLSNLQVLFLQCNKLTEIPDNLAQLRHLRILDIRFNPLEKFPKLPESLTTLKIDQGQANKFPNELGEWLGKGQGRAVQFFY